MTVASLSAGLPVTLAANFRGKSEKLLGKEGENGSARLDVLPRLITSVANPFVKHCLKLRISSSYRHEHGSVVVVGSTPIREIYEFQDPTKDELTGVECLLMLDGAKIPEGLESLDDRVVHVSSMVMKKISGLESSDSIEAIAMMNLPKQYRNLHVNESGCHCWFPTAHRILVLEGIQDPGNMGTLLRSAMAFRWGGAFLLPGCCDPFNEKALRASRGASFQLPIISGSWSNLQDLTKHHQMKLLAGHPSSKDDQNHIQVSQLSHQLAHSLAHKPLCLLLGSEGSGLSPQAIQASDLISIPMSGDFESLNVSVAGGIFLYMLQI